MTREIISVPLDQINDDNIRSQMDSDRLQGLVESIRSVGQLSPVRLRPVGNGFVPIDGHRRVHALRLLGEKSVQAIVESVAIDDTRKLEQALISNIQREDLSPLDKARGIAELMRASNQKACDVAARLGMKPSEVTKHLAYLRFSPELAQRLVEKGVGPTTVYELARIEDATERAVRTDELLQGNLTREKLIALSKRAISRKPSSVQTGSCRFSAPMASGQCVNVVCQGSGDLDDVIGLLEEVLQRARKARSKGLSAKTLSKMLREEVKANSGTIGKEGCTHVG